MCLSHALLFLRLRQQSEEFLFYCLHWEHGFNPSFSACPLVICVMSFPTINEKNLIPLNRRPKSEQREIQRKGTKASAKKRAEEKTFRELAKAVLPTVISDDEMKEQARRFGIDEEVSVKMLTVIGVIKSACSGDVKAFEKLEQLIGEEQADNGQIEKLVEGLKNENI